MSAKKLECPDGRTAYHHITQLGTVAEFLSLADRARLKEIANRSESLATNSDSKLQSLDIMEELNATIATLSLLRDGIMGVSDDKGLSKQDFDTVKLISTTITTLIKNAQLLKEMDRVSALQRGLIEYADRLTENQKPKFIKAVKQYIELDLSVEM